MECRAACSRRTDIAHLTGPRMQTGIRSRRRLHFRANLRCAVFLSLQHEDAALSEFRKVFVCNQLREKMLQFCDETIKVVNGGRIGANGTAVTAARRCLAADSPFCGEYRRASFSCGDFECECTGYLRQLIRPAHLDGGSAW